MLKLFGNLGICQGMLEFFSEAGIKLAPLIALLRGKRVPGVEI
ncbi:YufK family protein [Bacillus sp. R1-10]